MLEFTRSLACGKDNFLLKQWPKNHYECMKVLKECRYTDPITYYACFNEQHPHQWSLLKNKNENCTYSESCVSDGYIPMYYLSLKDKIRKWCKNPNMCKKMTYHWRVEKDHWFQSVSPFFPVKEVWDGTRFNELSTFWDPDS